MNEQIFDAMLKELKAIHQETSTTNQRIDKLEQTTDKRMDGLLQSVIVLQQGVGEVRYELQNIKGILSDRVIWQNDNIAIQTREGSVIYGVIQKSPKK